MMTPCKHCGEWAMRPTHAESNCPDRAWAMIGDGIKAAMEADPSKTVGEVIEMAVTWAQHFSEEAAKREQAERERGWSQDVEDSHVRMVNARRNSA